MSPSDFDFHLPEDLIAQYPSEERTGSRLLHLDCASGQIVHHNFIDLLDLIDRHDLLVFNNTRVIPARLHGRKASGGRVELLVERVLDARTVLTQVRSSKPVRAGGLIYLADDVKIRIVERVNEFYKVRFLDADVASVLRQYGKIPLPPYITREADEADVTRYQTVYAEHDGAVAAPTAGLHFDEAMMLEIGARGIDTAFLTLHVGAGTFQPIRVEHIEDHRMHSEQIVVPEETCAKVLDCKGRGARVIAVGTTTVRCLETASTGAEIRPYEGETDIFIYPGYEFKCVDAMLTNFHLPGSTLIMLVSAFAGLGNIQAAYGQAIEQRYRFFSYGDAMLIT